MSDLTIIGGGPAALSAAIYALGKRLDLRLVADELGGKAAWRQRLVGQLADEFLAGEEAVQTFERRLADSACLLPDRVGEVRRDGDEFVITTQQHGELRSAAVIIATGATPLELPVPGAREFLGQGLGYSLTTHAPLTAGKTAAVIGNTLRALRGTAELAQFAANVYLIVPDVSVLAAPLGLALQQRPNVELLPAAQVREIGGSFNVEEIIVEQAGQFRRLAVDAAFVDLGLRANSGPVRQLLDLQPGQFISVDQHNATAVPGLFAAGDVTTAFGEQTLIAIGDGARAALSAYDFLLTRVAAHTLVR